MIFDFSCTCKTYDKNNYSKKSFSTTRCPKCPAIGRFNLHGSYMRHVIYIDNYELVQKRIDIKRIRCVSCKSAHAVMPGDIIPYRLLSLYAVIFILILLYVRKEPVLKLAGALLFSFQFIYSVMNAFLIHINHIHQYFMETPQRPSFDLNPESVLILIRKPYTKFQSGYFTSNRRPCFMCKFFNKGGAPPMGILAVEMPSGGQQHHL
jgi:uncharacterized C2H2 Zn-finger protein